MVIVNDDITNLKINIRCRRCGNIQERFTDRSELITLKQEVSAHPCPSCGAMDFEIEEKEIVDYLEELASISGTKVEVISGKSEEGSQIGSLGKIGAILRYRPASHVY